MYLTCVFPIQPCCTLDEDLRCRVTSSTEMQCRAPSLEEIPEMQVQLLTQQEGVAVSIGLVMDGVTDLLDVNTTVTVYQNPEIDEFSSVQEYEQNNEITLTITVSMCMQENNLRIKDKLYPHPYL